LPSIDFYDEKQLCQLHQFFISCDMIGGVHADLSVSVKTLKEKHGHRVKQPLLGCLSTLLRVSSK
jgi:hypothetical protein